ncbi:YdbC family protein [Paenisporosarcina sp. TG20]|uniref:YdbC family protein n=1 Tax=Paenisporosarcina sp. TG20 TaxID=1211706 RepID=UPI0002F62E1B|nr:PC4/YdbC family ssDNA-binding protein [Paenisporosarcina sp. TG20]
MAEIKFEIIETMAVLSESNKGWKRQLNLISWNDRDPKYDIRDWSEDQGKMGKGITFTLKELQALKDALNELHELE